MNLLGKVLGTMGITVLGAALLAAPAQAVPPDGTFTVEQTAESVVTTWSGWGDWEFGDAFIDICADGTTPCGGDVYDYFVLFSDEGLDPGDGTFEIAAGTTVYDVNDDLVSLPAGRYQFAYTGDSDPYVSSDSVAGCVGPDCVDAVGVPPTPSFTLTSSLGERGSCWPTVSGLGGTWVQLTDSGCVPPSVGSTLLGWATSPNFPIARAKNGVVVDEDFGGVRMIFIPLNGYTFLSSDNTLYPIWST